MAQDNLFSTASDAYKQFRPQYPSALFQFLAQMSPSNSLAWDCGCGNGQASVVLANYFQHVIATDVSTQQIAEAEKANNVQYLISPAETIDADANSIDLITVAQAIHWFNHPVFFTEVDRVLKPNGIFAAWGYQLLYSDSPLDSVIEKLHTEIVGPFWPKGRELLDEGYTKIPFIYPREQVPPFKMQCRWQFSHLIGYLNTWSAVKAYENHHKENPIQPILPEIQEAWGDKSQTKTVYWPLILYVGKKPA